jgi:hypothetical protein
MWWVRDMPRRKIISKTSDILPGGDREKDALSHDLTHWLL